MTTRRPGITALLKGFGTDTDAVKEKYESLVQSGETQIAAKLSDYIVEPAAETLSNALAMLAVFVAAILLLNLAVFLLDLVFKLPVLHFANKFGGFLFGLAARSFSGLCVLHGGEYRAAVSAGRRHFH